MQTDSPHGDPGNFCLWNQESGKFELPNPKSWALEFRIQLKESGIPLTIGIRISSPTDGAWNPESTVWYPESKKFLEFPFTGRKRQCACSKKIALLVVLALLVSGI